MTRSNHTYTDVCSGYIKIIRLILGYGGKILAPATGMITL